MYNTAAVTKTSGFCFHGNLIALPSVQRPISTNVQVSMVTDQFQLPDGKVIT